jgi:predicted GNAT family acetyltransferase
MTQDAVPRVVRNDNASQYELQLDGKVVGFAEFRVRPDHLVFTHTETDPYFEGRGLGSILAKGALEDVRSRGERIKAECPFIAAYIKRHGEYADLLFARA